MYILIAANLESVIGDDLVLLKSTGKIVVYANAKCYQIINY